MVHGCDFQQVLKGTPPLKFGLSRLLANSNFVSILVSVERVL